MSDDAREIVRRLASMEPYGLIAYEADWSDVTPGSGPEYGCRFCGEPDNHMNYAESQAKKLTARFTHAGSCIWVAARKLLGLP